MVYKGLKTIVKKYLFIFEAPQVKKIEDNRPITYCTQTLIKYLSLFDLISHLYFAYKSALSFLLYKIRPSLLLPWNRNYFYRLFSIKKLYVLKLLKAKVKLVYFIFYFILSLYLSS